MKPRILKTAAVLSGGLLALLIGAPQAVAGCQINLGVSNTGTESIEIQKKGSKVKSKGGTWRRLSAGGWRALNLSPGRTETDVYSAGFGCTAKRRFRIEYQCSGQSAKKVDYYPSATGWTTNINPVVNLGRCT